MDEHFQKEFFKKFPKDINDSTKQIAIVLKTYLNFIFYSSMYKKRALKGLLITNFKNFNIMNNY